MFHFDGTVRCKASLRELIMPRDGVRPDRRAAPLGTEPGPWAFSGAAISLRNGQEAMRCSREAESGSATSSSSGPEVELEGLGRNGDRKPTDGFEGLPARSNPHKVPYLARLPGRWSISRFRHSSIGAP